MTRKYISMRLLPIATLLLTVALWSLVSSCDDDDNNWDRYKEWREINNNFFEEQRFKMENGMNYYQTLTPVWNSSAQILIRYLNDRTKTEGNLSPLYTSIVDVKYIGRLCDDTPFDSSYTLTANGDSIYRTSLTSVIDGWAIALQDMRVGDSARIVIPYALAYGASTNSGLLPYSTLVFDVKLVDIPFYEVRP